MAVITVDEAKNYLKVNTTDDDALITVLIAAAERLVEKATGRTLVTTDFVYVIDNAPYIIYIPHSPLKSITKISVITEGGAEINVDSSIYAVDTKTYDQGRVYLLEGHAWPEHRAFASFIISGKAGYGDTAASVPEALRLAVLIALAKMYENRGAVSESKVMGEISALCAPYRVMKL